MGDVSRETTNQIVKVLSLLSSESEALFFIAISHFTDVNPFSNLCKRLTYRQLSTTYLATEGKNVNKLDLVTSFSTEGINVKKFDLANICSSNILLRSCL